MRAAIFDFDGVLADSEPLHYRALRDCLDPEGIVVSEDDYASFYLAYSDREAIRLALERQGVSPSPERVDAIAGRKARLFESMLPEVALYPGARDLVLALAARVPVGIASGALRAEIEAILRAHGLRESFVVIVGADDVARGKPDPAPYLAALASIRRAVPDLRPQECLVVEDSMAGIAAARSAGMITVGVTHSYPAERLTAAHHVVEALAELEPGLLARLFDDGRAGDR